MRHRAPIRTRAAVGHHAPARIARSVVSAIVLPVALAGASIATNVFAQTFRFETVDSIGIVGTWNSLALDAYGNPHIVYYDANLNVVKYTHRMGGAWVGESVPVVGQSFPTFALDPQGRPAISYSSSDLILRLARKLDGIWTVDSVDTVGAIAGGANSFAFDAAGNPHIAYLHARQVPPGSYRYTLKYAHLSGPDWIIETLSTGDPGRPSLVLDPQGNPHLAYSRGIYRDLVYAQKTPSWTFETVDSSLLSYIDPSPRLALDKNNDPHIIYFYTGDPFAVRIPRYAHKSAGVWSREIVDPVREVSSSHGLALDSQGQPHVSYYDFSPQDLCYAYRSGGSWIAGPLDADGCKGSENSLAVDAQDHVHISYNDCSHADLEYATTAQITGVPVTPDGAFFLGTPRPNPSTDGAAAFTFRIARRAQVSLELYGVSGQRLAVRPAAWLAAGTHTVRWDPGVRAPGLYWVRLRTASGESANERWIVLR